MSTLSDTQPLILALHPEVPGPSLYLSRLIGALSAQGAELKVLGLPLSPLHAELAGAPSLAELKAGLNTLAESVSAALRGDHPHASPEEVRAENILNHTHEAPAAVIMTNAALAEKVFPLIRRRWPETLKIALEGDFHIQAKWERTGFDALITPHPTLGAELSPIREGRARLYAGGPIIPEEGERKSLGSDKARIVMSVSRLEPSEIDPLLFQLSLTEPERYHLLFLPSGRSDVDDLVRSRALGYGLSGKRPKVGSDPEPWIRGADLLIGFPSPAESACAVSAKLPQVFFTPHQGLGGGESFIVQHGLALHAPNALTLAVQVDHALPGGLKRSELEEALERFETDGPAGAAGCVLRSIRDGRVSPDDKHTKATHLDSDDELEDIGQPALSGSARALDARSRKAYLKEIILQQGELKRQVKRARSGVDTWSHRRRLAQNAGDERLQSQASLRVEGIQRVLNRLVAQERHAQGLRERFASAKSLSPEDMAQAEQLISPEASTTIERLSKAAEQGAFERLEIEDALTKLKRRMGEDT